MLSSESPAPPYRRGAGSEMTPNPPTDPPAETQRMFDALSSPIRREILWRVWDEELPVAAISRVFSLAAPTISRHLTVLRDAGLVTMRVDGTFRRYRARREAMPALDELLAGARSRWQLEEPAPGRAAGTSAQTAAVVLAVEAGGGQSAAFAAFRALFELDETLDPSAFVMPVGNGLALKGTFEQVHPPSILVLRLDSAEEGVPTPGDAERAFVTFTAGTRGCRVDVVQLVRNQAQGRYMEAAWRTVLGRITAFVT